MPSSLLYMRSVHLGNSGIRWHPFLQQSIFLVSGDFNAILYTEEKLGGNPPDHQAEFNDALSAANLLDAGYIGSRYTWCNNQENSNCIRVDRCLVNSSWLLRYSHTAVQDLSRTLSDHAPLLLSWREQAQTEPRPSRSCGLYMQISSLWWLTHGSNPSTSVLCMLWLAN